MSTEIAEITTNKQLSDREQLFLEVLMTEAGGDFTKAKKLAGYPNNKPVIDIVRRLKEEILEVSQLYLAQNVPVAVNVLVNIALGEGDLLGSREKLNAAKEILDRVGIVKTTKSLVKHEHEGGVKVMPMALPEKFKREDDNYG